MNVCADGCTPSALGGNRIGGVPMVHPARQSCLACGGNVAHYETDEWTASKKERAARLDSSLNAVLSADLSFTRFNALLPALITRDYKNPVRAKRVTAKDMARANRLMKPLINEELLARGVVKLPKTGASAATEEERRQMQAEYNKTYRLNRKYEIEKERLRELQRAMGVVQSPVRQTTQPSIGNTAQRKAANRLSARARKGVCARSNTRINLCSADRQNRAKKALSKMSSKIAPYTMYVDQEPYSSIAIDPSVLAATRVEKLEYKEIEVPKSVTKRWL
jgi:hypothetical protein